MLPREESSREDAATGASSAASDPFVVVLGVAQDAGYPQAGCQGDCCRRAWDDSALRRHVVCLAIVDSTHQQRWMFECTPDFREQLELLQQLAPMESQQGRPSLTGIFVTHAHIGHYTGLMQLGREAMGAESVPVYAMPRMASFLGESAPWTQLIDDENIELRSLVEQQAVELNERIRVTPLLVPHRDEYSETVAFRIEGPNRSVLFLPDIDKWHRWETDVEDVLATVDRAYVDGTFFADDELPGRSMDEIPHPFIVESIDRFAALPESERNKIRFIHLNHTNPALDAESNAAQRIVSAGHAVAEQGERLLL